MEFWLISPLTEECNSTQRCGQSCATLGVRHTMTTSCHPKSDKGFSLFGNGRTGLAAAPSLGLLVYGSTLTLPGDFIDTLEPSASKFITSVQQLQPPRTRLQNMSHQFAKITGSLAEASHVYVRKGGAGPPLSPFYTGPYVIIMGRKTFHSPAWGRRSSWWTGSSLPWGPTSSPHDSLLPEAGLWSSFCLLEAESDGVSVGAPV
jgi:hypothetical protein